MKKIILSVILLILFYNIHAQEKQSIAAIKQEADDDYNSKNYKSATDKYLKVIELSDFKSQKLNAIYNAACCLALQKKIDSAYIYLDKALEYGFNYKSHLLSDSDLENLRNNPKWEELMAKIPEPKSLNDKPDLAKIITNDIHHFWKAYDLVENDSANIRDIYKAYYFDKASDGMEDYMGSKVSSIDYFIKHIQSHPKLYRTIRENTLKVDEYKKDIQQSFKNLKALYSEAKFPDVYFVIGAFTSGGTVSPSGLLIGTNQMSDGDNINTEELDFGDKLLMNKSKYLPHVVAHELIHFQQDEMKKDTITLGYTIKEGMADFLGELISGDSANRKIFEWAKGKEKKIWNDFKKDMLYDRYNNWIANYNSASEDSYPDLGYWIGYEICKSYYENAKDKKQAIYDMFHIQDYRKFLADSNWEKKLDEMK
ncbi:gliding motility protein GldB-related protein [Psychroserpens sp.]